MNPLDPAWRPAPTPDRSQVLAIQRRVDELEVSVSRLQGQIRGLGEALNEAAGWLASLRDAQERIVQAGERSGRVVDALVGQAQRAGWELQ